MGNLTNFEKWKYSFWTLGVFLLVTNPFMWRALFSMTGNAWITWMIQSIVFLLLERSLMEINA